MEQLTKCYSSGVTARGVPHNNLSGLFSFSPLPRRHRIRLGPQLQPREELTAIKKYQEPDGRLRYLSGPEEADQLLRTCDEALRPIVLTALHTGMRRGEVLGLTWDQVDMTHGFIRLKQTKNGKAMALPFNETLWTLVSTLRTRQDVPWVFHDVDGHRYNDVRHAFDRACEAAGMTDFHFHDLRHTFASWLVKAFRWPP